MVAAMFRLVAEDPGVSLDALQASRIKFWLLEFLPARQCQVRLEPPVEITVTGLGADLLDGLEAPLLEQVERVAGCRFRVTYRAD